MARELKSVRVDAELLAELERLARQRYVPVTFAEQVDAGLRLLVRRVTNELDRHSARLIGVDAENARTAYQRRNERGR